jgi:hypothetical protein
MLARLGGQLTYANVVATIALFVALSTGGAHAANTIISSDIADGEVKTPDIASAAVTAAKLRPGTVGADKIADGVVTSDKVKDNNLAGRDVLDNALKGADIDEATLDVGDAARAYAFVDPFDCTGTPTTCTPLQSKGISGVTRVVEGNYCVTAPGIDSAVTPAAVTVDAFSTPNPEGNASAMTSEFFECGPSDQGFVVFTTSQPVITVDAGGGTSNATAVGPAEPSDDVGFTIVIP